MVPTKSKEKILTAIFWLLALIIVGILFSLIAYIAVRGLPGLSMNFILQAPSRAGKEGGISTTILGTLYLTAVALLLAVPLGVAAAIYLEEYARPDSKFAWLVNLTAETLAGIPSIIFGLFGFMFFVIFLELGWSIISGALTLAFMILPTITRTAQEAILSVPREYRENSLALGAGKWQTVCRVVIPPALPGIITGIILSIGRAVGETAAIILTAGSSLNMPVSLSDSTRTMSVHLYLLAMEGVSLERAFTTAFLIIILIITINYLANLSLKRLAANN